MVGENYNSPQIFMTIIKVRGRSNLEGWNWRPGLFTFDGLGQNCCKFRFYISAATSAIWSFCFCNICQTKD